MKKPPEISEIKAWLTRRNPLGLFRGAAFSVRDIDPKQWSGHFNYLVRVGKGRLVLRFKGPEWGRQTKGIIDEYNILKAVEKYRVGPRAYHVNRNFFGEPAMLEEYLDGKIISNFSPKVQEKIFPEVARFIAKVNRIPVRKGSIPFREAMTSYARHKRTWRSRLTVILRNPRTRPLGREVKKLLPGAERMLDCFEPRLRRALRQNGPVFVFESSHAGHCMKTKIGLRFLNWEQISFGDPSYTLAVFLASLIGRKDFPRLKERMVKEYLQIRPIPEFSELVDARLKEREVSNLMWALWVNALEKKAHPTSRRSGVGARLRRVEEILAAY